MINPAFIPDDFFKVLAPSDIFGAAVSYTHLTLPTTERV